MNLKNPITVTVILAISLMFRCSPIVSGGTGTETVNTFARLPGGAPACGATAKIVAARWWIDSVNSGVSPILGETIADCNGRISIVIEEPHDAVNLQIDHENGAILYPLKADLSNLTDTVYLRCASSLSGSIDANETSSSRILLSGSSYAATVDAAGAFAFNAIAPGSYGIVSTVIRPSDPVLTEALTLEEGTVISNISLVRSQNRLLVDNFESGVGPTSLGRIFPVLGWYVLSDSIYYHWVPKDNQWKRGISAVIGTSPIYYDSVVTDTNVSFSVATVLDRVSPMANALFGFSFQALKKKGINLSSMTAVSLRASGNGILRLRLESLGLDSINSRLSHYTYPLKLTDTPATYVIPVDSLRIIEPIPDPTGYPWQQESKNILRLEFEFSVNDNTRGDSLFCTIDDLYFEGVSLNDISSR